MISLLMRWLARLPLQYPRRVLWGALLLTVVASIFIPRLHVSTDRNLLAGEDSAAFKRREEISRQFGTSNVSVAIIEADSQQLANQVADALATKLREYPAYIRDVFYKADTSFFESHALMFVPPEKIEAGVTALNDGAFRLQVFENTKNLSELILSGAELLKEQTAVPEGQTAQIARAVDSIESLLAATATWFQSDTAESFAPLEQLKKDFTAQMAIPEMPDTGGYFTATDGKAPFLAIVFIQPTRDSQGMEVVAPLTDLIRDVAAKVTQTYGGRVYVSGLPSLATDELRMVSRDCVVAGVIAGLGVLIVFILAYRSLRISLFLVLPLGAGLIWAAGFTGLIYAHLTMITSYFAAVLFGLGVAFTIHIVDRFHEALAAGQSKSVAMETALAGAGPGVIVGALTTAFAFLAIMFSEFQGFAEMGVISGVGIIMILIANMTLLPAALLLWHPGRNAVQVNRFIQRFSANRAERPSSPSNRYARLRRWSVIVIGTGLFVAGIVAAPHVKFNYAVESMLPSSSDAVTGMKILNERTPFSTTFSMTAVNSPGKARKLTRAFQRLATVSKVESVAMFVPENQSARVRALSGLHTDVKSALLRISRNWRAISAAPEFSDKDSLIGALEELQFTLKDLAFDAERAGRVESQYLERLSAAARTAAQAVKKSDAKRVKRFETLFFKFMAQLSRVARSAAKPTVISPINLPDTIRRRYVSADGKQFAVIVYPAGDIGEKSFFYRHVQELLRVDSSITGHPVTHYAFTAMIQKGFTRAVLLSALTVLLLVLMDLRSATGLLLSLGPVVLAAGWTALLMYFTGLKFNYANLMGLPILIGTGVDYGVHLAHRYKQEGSMRIALQTTGRAVILSAITTLIGFGSLLAGDHWGVKSLGILLVSGILFAAIAAIVVLPVIVSRERNR